mmetsp:Transcript_34804/g.84126  ORF Transcript_34804/g.84126 Transcript_34804/m.84126 type:complete len:96 (+) Transcript_34804:273-560(+)
MVDNRCATTTTVRPTIARSIADCTSCSDSASKAEVASSSSNTRQLVNRARAIAILCFCPPLSLTPFSPTNVSYPVLHELIKSWALASIHTRSNRS